MSETTHTKNKPYLNAVDMSATSQTSEIIEIGEDGGYAVHSVFTGAPVGTLEVKGSNTLTIGDFVTVDSYAITEAGSRLLNVEKARYSYVIVVYTKASGTGSLTSTVSAKRD